MESFSGARGQQNKKENPEFSGSLGGSERPFRGFPPIPGADLQISPRIGFRMAQVVRYNSKGDFGHPALKTGDLSIKLGRFT